MKYLLDTNTCIRYINGRSEGVQRKLPTVPAKEIIVCSIVRGELAYCAGKSQTPESSSAKQQRFLQPYASLPYDMQIAAIALVHKLILVTHNTQEFSRIPNLKLEDWEL
jgi:tRNA(fMet)-specific endonuclease VapC